MKIKIEIIRLVQDRDITENSGEMFYNYIYHYFAKSTNHYLQRTTIDGEAPTFALCVESLATTSCARFNKVQYDDNGKVVGTTFLNILANQSPGTTIEDLEFETIDPDPAAKKDIRHYTSKTETIDLFIQCHEKTLSIDALNRMDEIWHDCGELEIDGEPTERENEFAIRKHVDSIIDKSDTLVRRGVSSPHNKQIVAIHNFPELKQLFRHEGTSNNKMFYREAPFMNELKPTASLPDDEGISFFDDYYDAFDQLYRYINDADPWIDHIHNGVMLLSQARVVLDSVYKAHSEFNELELTEVLNLTYNVLRKPSYEQLKAYEGLADRVTNGRQPSSLRKNVGGAMIALGATLAVMSLLTVIPAVSITLGIAALSTLLAISFISASAGFFAGGAFAIQKGRRSGLSKAVKDFEQAVEADLSDQFPMNY